MPLLCHHPTYDKNSKFELKTENCQHTRQVKEVSNVSYRKNIKVSIALLEVNNRIKPHTISVKPTLIVI